MLLSFTWVVVEKASALRLLTYYTLQPNVDLARQAQLEIDSVDGGIMVNSELQARSHIYAVSVPACCVYWWQCLPSCTVHGRLGMWPASTTRCWAGGELSTMTMQ